MSAAVDVVFKALYVQGGDQVVDDATLSGLRASAPDLLVTAVAGASAALTEVRRTAGWHALLVSPALAQHEMLALVAALRRDRLPLAIVPILDETHQDQFASAVAAGADDVLVRHGIALVNVEETLVRIRQSPHLHPVEQRRRIVVLYAGHDPLVWNLLDQVPFVNAERAVCGPDGDCPVRAADAAEGVLLADAIVIDEHPGDAHPLQVLKSVKAQASDLPAIVLTSAGGTDIATAALELGADDTVLKTGIFRRRLIATLRRVHQRLDQTSQQIETRAREERLRQIVENVPAGIIVVAGDGHVLAMNGAALLLFGAGSPRDVVGRDVRDLVAPHDREAIGYLIEQVTTGQRATLPFEARTIEGDSIPARIEAVMLERDARGGRGVVASVTRAVSVEPVLPDTTELDDLRVALDRMQGHFADLEATRAQERAAWEQDRRLLETRAADATRVAAERSALEARLEDVTAELGRAGQALAAERASLELRVQELEAAARQAEAAGADRLELERALSAAREEQRHAAAAHDDERVSWEMLRAALESRLRDLDARDTERAATVAARDRDVDQVNRTLADERAQWQAREREIEDALRNAQDDMRAAALEHEAARAAVEAELERLRPLAAEVPDLRRQLAEERDLAGVDRHGLREQAERAEEATRALADEYDATRARLVGERDEAQASLEAERAAWHDRQARYEADLAALSNQAQLAQQRWEEERRGRQDELDRTVTAVRTEWEARVAELRAALDRSREETERREREWADERRHFESARATLQLTADQDRNRLLAQHAEQRQAFDEAAGARDEALAAREALTATLDAVRGELERAQQRVRDVDGELDLARRHAAEHSVTLDAARSEIRHTDATHREERRQWEQARQALTARIQEIEAAFDAERQAWTRARTRFEQDERDVARLRHDKQRVDETLAALRTDHAAVTEALANDRATLDRQRREIDALRAELDDASERRADLEAMLAHTTRTAEARVRDQAAALGARIAALEADLALRTTDLASLTEESRRRAASLRADYEGAADAVERLIASNAFGFAVTTVDGHLVRCNDALARALGFVNADDARVRTAGRPFPGLSGRPQVTERLLADGQVDEIVSCVERIDGRVTRLVESALLLDRDDVGDNGARRIEHIVVAGPAGPTDEELHSRRLQEVGVLATAMVPEIESLVAAVHERGATLVQRTAEGEAAAADAATMQSLVTQATTLVRQLAAFSRRQVVGPATIDLGRAVSDAEPMLARLVGDYITFSTEIGAATPISARPEELDQLMTSLVTLGRDLLPAGGSIVVGVRQEAAPAGTSGYTFGVPGPLLSVSASGYGVQVPPPAHALELVAQRCGGRLRIGGEPGWTVRLDVSFPRCSPPAPPSWTWVTE